MGWTNTQPDELTAPGGVPFLPGNNVSGFGSQVPPELTAAGFPNAFVMYTTAWNPAAVVPTIKFWFMAANSTGLVFGYGTVPNPSVSQTATVVSGEIVSTYGGGGTDSDILYKDTGGNPYAELLTLSGQGADFFLFDAAGTKFSRFAAQTYPDKSSLVTLGSFGDDAAVSFQHNPGETFFRSNNVWLLDVTWTAVSLLNNWAAYGTAGDWYQGLRIRKSASNWVTLNGTLQAPAVANGTIASIPAGYRPDKRATNVCNIGTAATWATIHAYSNGNLIMDAAPINTFANINVGWQAA